jgi:hypothetical protein
LPRLADGDGVAACSGSGSGCSGERTCEPLIDLTRRLEADDREVRPLLDQLDDVAEVFVMGSPSPTQDVIAVVEHCP